METVESPRDNHLSTGNNATFAYEFKLFDDSHMLVTIVDLDGLELELDLDDDYTVSGVGDPLGGTISLVNSGQSWINSSGYLISGYNIYLRRSPPATQLTEFQNQADYYPEVHEDAIDLAVHLAQSVKDIADRSIKIRETESIVDMFLPSITERAGKVLAFDDDGYPTTSSDPLGDGIIVSPFMETVLDDTTAAAARTTLGFAGAGGTAQAANLEADAVTTAKILDSNVTTPKIADGAVTKEKLFSTLIDSMTAVQSAPDDYAAIADASDSNTNKKGIIASIANMVKYRASSGNTTATTEDGCIEMSGAIAIVTLYTAVGNAGREIEIVHAGTSLTEYYGIASSDGLQTIGGFSGSGSAYRLVTNGESLRLRSNGANWLIVGHITATEWVNAGAVGIGGSTTAPTKGTATIYIDEMWWRRVGDSADIRFAFRKTANGTATAGSGNYIFQVPTGMVINTSRITAEGTAETAAPILKKSACGFITATISTTNVFVGMAAVFDSTGVTFGGINTSTVPSISHSTIRDSFYQLTNADVSYRGYFNVPISTWKA